LNETSEEETLAIRVAINGFGRIGEMVFRAICDDPRGIDIVAINDIVPLEQLEYLLRFDSVHPPPKVKLESGPGWIRLDGEEAKVFMEKDPANLPWADLGVDVAIDASGVFETREGLQKHLDAGAKKVVLTAPAKKDGADITICMGVNDRRYDPAAHHIVSNASCTTNCLAPVVRCIDEAFGMEWGLMSTVHAYTGSQALVDRADKDRRRGRAAALNIVPSTTGAAKAIGLVLPHLAGKIDGMAFRVPVPDGSITDLVFETREPFTVESLHGAFRAAEGDPSYRGVLTLTEHELVSSDIVHSPYSAIVDSGLTLTMGERRGKVLAWYDNEWGYALRVCDLVAMIGEAMRQPAPA
jgi:glyceraldehyde 3-phosphate dehydrogenase